MIIGLAKSISCSFWRNSSIPGMPSLGDRGCAGEDHNRHRGRQCLLRFLYRDCYTSLLMQLLLGLLPLLLFDVIIPLFAEVAMFLATKDRLGLIFWRDFGVTS